MFNWSLSVRQMLIFTLLVFVWVLAEALTSGKFRLQFIIVGSLVGFSIGLSREIASADGEMADILPRAVARAALYVIPLAFCDSILVIGSLPGVLGKVAGIYMLAVQVVIVLYLWRRSPRPD